MLWLVALVVADARQRAGDQPASTRSSRHRSRPGRCRSSTLRHGIPSSDRDDRRRSGDRRFGARAARRSSRARSAVPRQPRSRTCISRCVGLRRCRRRGHARRTQALIDAARAPRRRAERAATAPDRFYFFHRARRWNAGEARWMGWERKRGKLDEFNRLLRGATDTSFIVQHGDLSILTSGPLRHHARLRHAAADGSGAASGRHAVASAQPPALRRRAPARDRGLRRAAAAHQVSVVSANRTIVRAGLLRARRRRSVHHRRLGLYQDIFREGSYVGKGIYDVDAFERALAGRVPENTLLSHDLFEGFYARAGLVHRHRSRRRLSRRTTWRSPRGSTAGCAATGRSCAGCGEPCPTRAAGRCRTRCRSIARWKILDNLRRSLMPARAAGAARRGWTVLPGSAVAVDGARAAGAGLPGLHAGRAIAGQPRRRRAAARAHPGRARQHPHQRCARRRSPSSSSRIRACVMVDAIGRTLVRMLVTRRRLLEWVTADRAETDAACRADRLPANVARAPPWRSWSTALMAAVAPAIGCCSRSPILIRCGRSPRASRTSPGRPLPHRRGALGTAERAAFRAVAPQDVALLRRLGDRRATLADPRQQSGESPRAHRAPHLADEHRPAAARDARRVRSSGISRFTACSTASSRRSPRCSACSGIAAISTTGTTPGRSRRSRPPTFRPSTAAIWPGICSRCAPD